MASAVGRSVREREKSNQTEETITRMKEYFKVQSSTSTIRASQELSLVRTSSLGES